MRSKASRDHDGEGKANTWGPLGDLGHTCLNAFLPTEKCLWAGSAFHSVPYPIHPFSYTSILSSTILPSIYPSIIHPSLPPSVQPASQPPATHPSSIHSPSIHPFTHLYIHPSVHLSILPSLHPSICTSIHSSVPPSILPSTHLYIQPSVHLSIHSPLLYAYVHICTENYPSGSWADPIRGGWVHRNRNP